MQLTSICILYYSTDHCDAAPSASENRQHINLYIKAFTPWLFASLALALHAVRGKLSDSRDDNCETKGR